VVVSSAIVCQSANLRSWSGPCPSWTHNQWVHEGKSLLLGLLVRLSIGESPGS